MAHRTLIGCESLEYLLCADGSELSREGLICDKRIDRLRMPSSSTCTWVGKALVTWCAQGSLSYTASSRPRRGDPQRDRGATCQCDLFEYAPGVEALPMDLEDGYSSGRVVLEESVIDWCCSSVPARGGGASKRSLLLGGDGLHGPRDSARNLGRREGCMLMAPQGSASNTEGGMK
jgi:hypothetical protein